VRFLPTVYTKHLEAIVHTLLCTVDVLFRRVDVVHYHGVGPALLAWVPRLLKPRARVVVTFHAQDRFHQKWGPLSRLALHVGEWMACHAPHATITVSHGMQTLVQKEYGCRAAYIPSGATVKEGVSARALVPLHLSPRGYVLAVGRLLPVKGYHHLVRAFREVRTDKQLVIVGAPAEPGYREELERLAQGDARIRFLGQKSGEELDTLYAHAAVFCQPSESEGLPLAVLEAMSFGLPVLVSDIPGNMEAIARTGFTFINRDVADLAAQLQYLVVHEAAAQAAGAESKRMMVRDYDWSALAAKVEAVYTRLRPSV
jgi:glycosyltransferase involved in cell wall biosynthesis